MPASERLSMLFDAILTDCEIDGMAIGDLVAATFIAFTSCPAKTSPVFFISDGEFLSKEL